MVDAERTISAQEARRINHRVGLSVDDRYNLVARCAATIESLQAEVAEEEAKVEDLAAIARDLKGIQKKWAQARGEVHLREWADGILADLEAVLGGP